MKRKAIPFILTLVFSLMIFFAGGAGAESINALQQNLGSNQIATGGSDCPNSSNSLSSAAEQLGTTIKSGCQGISQSCGQIGKACSGFFGRLKSVFSSFFQNLISIFQQIIKSISNAFNGCANGSSNGNCNQNNAPNSADESSSGNDSDSSTAGDNSTTGNAPDNSSGNTAGDNSSNSDGSSQTPPANQNQGATAERPAGEAAGVDTSSAQSLINALKSKFGITIENGTAQWSLSQLQQTYELLTKLPPSFIAETKMIQRIATTSLGPNVGGYVSSNAPRVYLTNHGTASMTFVLVHEMAHCFHFAKDDVFSRWQSQFWNGRNGYSGSGSQKSPSVSSYGNSNAMEDFAESVRAYYMNGPSMKRTHPDRYEFVKQYVMAGVEY